MKLKTLLLPLLLISAASAFGNTVTRLDSNGEPAEINKPFRLTFTFSGPPNTVSCGMVIDWGNGSIERMRFGEGQQVPLPFVVEHTYQIPGQYKLRLAGEAMMRGLRSVGACDVRVDGTLTVVDPVEAAKQAAQKAVAEREQRERAETEARVRREREEAQAATAAAEKYRRDAEALVSMRALLSKASIKSCDQFEATFRSRFEYAFDWPSLNCSLTTDNEAAFVILARNLSRSGGSSYTNFYYQPKTETVLQITGNNAKTIYRAANFVDVRKGIDMNAEGDIDLRHLPDAQRRQVCDRISTVVNNFVSLHEFRMTAGYEVAEIATAGNWDFSIAKVDGSCEIRIEIAGAYKGTSYRKVVNCSIGSVVKRSDGRYIVKDMGYGRRQGCR